ncbi:MAG: hypothetical protein LBQ66_00385 [Planctomycetaceae bacterium]|jgi:hypothetical protein|nr:hypothetical protein [Planctomycetaceae bacterium]
MSQTQINQLTANVNQLTGKVVDGKAEIADAISEKGVAALGTDSFVTLAAKIRQLPTGTRRPYLYSVLPTNYATYDVARAKAGEYAIFAGGRDQAGTGQYTVEAISPDLTMVTLPDITSTYVSGGSVGSYALFAPDGTLSNKIEAYNSDLTKVTVPVLSQTKHNVSEGASVGDYVLFGGGWTTAYVATVNAYNSSLVRSTPTALKTARIQMGGVGNGEYALFIGGDNANGVSGTVDAYNSSLVRSNPITVLARRKVDAVKFNDKVIISGGLISSSVVSERSDTVEILDQSLVKTTMTILKGTSKDIVTKTAVIGEFLLMVTESSVPTLESIKIDVFNSAMVRLPIELYASDYISKRTFLSVGDHAMLYGGKLDSSNLTSRVDVFKID